MLICDRCKEPGEMQKISVVIKDENADCSSLLVVKGYIDLCKHCLGSFESVLQHAVNGYLNPPQQAKGK